MADRRRPPPAWLLVPHEQKARLDLEFVRGAPLQVVRYSGPPPVFLPFEEPQPVEQVASFSPQLEPGAERIAVELALLAGNGGGHG